MKSANRKIARATTARPIIKLRKINRKGPVIDSITHETPAGEPTKQNFSPGLHKRRKFTLKTTRIISILVWSALARNFKHKL